MSILIADDDPITLLALRRSMEAFHDEVLIASNGEEAWRIVRDRPDVRLAILDWMMPGLDGIELCRRARLLTDRPYVYLILLTAKTFREDRLAGLAWADDFLTKPLDRAELVARMNVAHRLLRAQEELRSRSEQLERLHVELKRQNEQLAELATTDGLTGLKNYRFFRASLAVSLSFANRQNMPLSLVMLDVDNFKAYNDAFGHPAGDEVLRVVARTLRDGVRDHDLVARYGGEEFVLVLPAADPSASRSIGERVRAAIAARPWAHRAVTASLGVATTSARVSTSSRLLDLADQALYQAKARGRDQVIHANDIACADEHRVADAEQIAPASRP